MTTGRIRDFVRAFLQQYGVEKGQSLPKMMIDELINTEIQNHFSQVKSLFGFYHTLVTKNLEEYELPVSLQSPTIVKVAGLRYYPVSYPLVEDAKDASIRSSDKRWYWVNGSSLFIYPVPVESTGIAVTGLCSVSANVITVSTGALGSDNLYRRHLIVVNGFPYIITSNSSTRITVADTIADAPAGTTYSIYNPGLAIEGVRIPKSITIGGNDNVPGTDLDGITIALKVAYVLGTTLPGGNSANFSNLLALYNDYFKRVQNNVHNKQRQGTLNLHPVTFRTDGVR